jgi:hypothetical protein
LRLKQIIYIETFCTKGVVLSFCISATTPLISIPALTINGDSQNLTHHSKPNNLIYLKHNMYKRLVIFNVFELKTFFNKNIELKE